MYVTHARTNEVRKYLAQCLDRDLRVLYIFYYPFFNNFLCPDRSALFYYLRTFFEEDMYERMKIAGGQMCHDAILTRKMRTTCVDISVLKTCSAGSTSFGGRTTRSRNPSRSASLNLTRGHTNLAITSEKGNAIHEPST